MRHFVLEVLSGFGISSCCHGPSEAKDIDLLRNMDLQEWHLSESLRLEGERAKAVEALDPAVISRLAASSSEEKLRRGALIALCHIGTDQELPSIELSFERFPRTRFEAGLALGKIGRVGKGVVEYLVQFTRSSDVETIRISVNALAILGKADAILFLEPLVDHPDCNVRATVLEALRRIPSNRVIPLLIRMIGQTDAGMACVGRNPMKRIWIGPEAISELERRSGESFGHYGNPPALINSPATEIKEAWERWWQANQNRFERQ